MACCIDCKGRGSISNDDNDLMYFDRTQWNLLGRYLDFEGCDLEFHEKPTPAIAFSAITNRSTYTRFSQAGRGSLDGFENGRPRQYRVNQWNFETAFMYRGFSRPSEWHIKEIVNKYNNND